MWTILTGYLGLGVLITTTLRWCRGPAPFLLVYPSTAVVWPIALWVCMLERRTYKESLRKYARRIVQEKWGRESWLNT